MDEASPLESMMVTQHVWAGHAHTFAELQKSRMAPTDERCSYRTQTKHSPPLSLPPRKHSANAIKVNILVDVKVSYAWDPPLHRKSH
jgi:hypothetical protein